ncbi:MAG: GMC family oxidoreductase [Candidatus Methanofastidiosa archaeon]|nr:GMC family oxidoreductase [Candidatus Methanofastidiosa archaeon]
MENIYDFIVVGSGAGGATLARELSGSVRSVLVLERGVMEVDVGGKKNFSRYVDIVKSLEGINIMRSIMAGGTTMISAGCSVRCIEKELLKKGIDISAELLEAEGEVGNAPLHENLISERSKTILKVSKDMGYSFAPMPKCYKDGCDGCGLCMTGCGRELKWTALDYLGEAMENGASIEYGADVKRVDKRNDGIFEVEVSREGKDESFFGKRVILCAGALETPLILLRSGIEDAGTNLSVDLLRHIYCFIPDSDFKTEPPMSIVDTEFHEDKGFMLATNINLSVVKKYIDSQDKEFPYGVNNSIGIMVKISDCPNGRVFPNGAVSKDVDSCDLMKFEEAFEIVKRIFLAAGADPVHIFESHINGAHPAGTAAIGTVVDEDLMTKTQGLYVCDASVFPAVPGLPTIITIVALAKRLGKHLKSKV